MWSLPCSEIPYSPPPMRSGYLRKDFGCFQGGGLGFEHFQNWLLEGRILVRFVLLGVLTKPLFWADVSSVVVSICLALFVSSSET